MAKDRPDNIIPDPPAKPSTPRVLLPAEPAGPAPYIPTWRRAVGYSMAGGGTVSAVEQLADGLPQNGEDWLFFALRAIAALIGLLIGGK